MIKKIYVIFETRSKIFDFKRFAHDFFVRTVLILKIYSRRCKANNLLQILIIFVIKSLGQGPKFFGRAWPGRGVALALASD